MNLISRALLSGFSFQSKAGCSKATIAKNFFRYLKAVVISLGIVFVCAASANAQYTIWPSTAVPAVPDAAADSPVELGVRFRADSNGYITGIRFYKSSANTGAHIGNLWTNTDTLLASATFTNETASGWQQVNFAKPVAITANTVYVASYHSTIGHYSATNSYFATSGVDNAPLHALANTSSSSDAPYCYGSTSCFPKGSYLSSNYWVDIVFTTGSGTVGNPLAVATTSLPNGTVAFPYCQTLSATGGTSPDSWSLSSGSLPAGLGLSSNGTISGTPTAAANSSLSVQVRDASGATASTPLGINVVNATPPTIAITSPANGATVTGTLNIAGTASDALSMTSVRVAVDGGSYSNAVGTANWSFSVNTTGLANGTHTFLAQVSDYGGRTAASSLLSLNINNSSLAGDCTLYASASGNDANSGSSPSAPKTFSGAAAASQPGSVVCLLGGTYNLSSTFVPPFSGTPSSWITYKAYGNSPVNFVWTGAADAEPMFKVGNGSFPSGPAYLIFQGFNLDGSGAAADGFFCRGGHHVSFLSNSISNTGGSGIGSINCDYLVADHNLINHNGYIPSSTSVPQYYSWTSAISFNTHLWFDNYPGIHSVISNNIITGEVDQSSNHTDGNGIILDLGGNTPPVLILNNVVYGNGGTCIIANQVQNFYVINNTCYDNALDPTEPNFPEFGVNGASNGYVVNNIAYAVSSGNPGYAQYNSVSNVSYYANLYYVGAPNFSSSSFTQADPLFLSAPLLAVGGFVTSLAPSLLGNDLTLTPLLSPALGKGIDASTISGLSSQIVSDLRKYIYTDINGKARPQGGSPDLSAYQH